MTKEFSQIEWDASLAADCLQIVRLAILEDLDRGYDWTTVALTPSDGMGQAQVVARETGVIAGLKAAELAAAEFDPALHWSDLCPDGTLVSPGQRVAALSGKVRSLLAAERTILNLIGRLSGIATLARKYVEAVAETQARIYDTRKTTPGWRRMEKYAVRQGGANNHRLGLYDAILIKDNHLAFGAVANARQRFTPAEAVSAARRFLAEGLAASGREMASSALTMIVEVEVDTIDQLRAVLPAGPDIVMLDNMSPRELAQAVAIRNQTAPQIELEASGGVNLETVGAIARTGVDRISVGALTHSARSLDVGLDWSVESPPKFDS